MESALPPRRTALKLQELNHEVTLVSCAALGHGADRAGLETPTTGLLTGNVKNPSGTMVPSARLTLRSPSGEQRTGTTAADGSHR